MGHDHFEGKGAFEHLKAARCKGAKASAENHGMEPLGAFSAGVDAARNMGMLLALGAIVLMHGRLAPMALGLIGLGYAIWLTCRSAMIGWACMERLHRLIEEERWEIEHNRKQEREELIEMYKLKGFSGKLLDDVIEVLMADDNRLLMVMLEEELGLRLCSTEHPLRQALGALIGSAVGFAFVYVGAIAGGIIGLWISFFLLYLGVGVLGAKGEGNHLIKGTVWQLMTGFFTVGLLYFLMELIHG